MDQLNGPSAAETQHRLERAIAGYLEDAARGIRQDPGQLLAAHPDLADELRQFLEDHDEVMQVADSWRLEVGVEADGRPAAISSSDYSTPASHGARTRPDELSALPAAITSPLTGSRTCSI